MPRGFVCLLQAERRETVEKNNNFSFPFKRGALALAIVASAPVAVMADDKYDYEGYQVESTVVAGAVSKEGPPWQHRPTFRIPGTKTDFAIGGYVKLDAYYDTDADLGGTINGPNLQRSSNYTDGRFNAHARETRVNIRTHTPTDWGPLTTFVEADFGGQPGANQSITDGTFYMRHAYIGAGNWLFGQTWTNAQTFVASPRIIKIGSPNGSVFERNPQARYTWKLPGASEFAVSLESSSPQIANLVPGASTIDANTPLPDFTARYRYKRMFELSGVVRQLEVEDASSTGMPDDSVLGWGVQAQFAYPILPKTMLKTSIFTGEGISDLITPRLADAYVQNGSLEAIEHTSGWVAIENRWTEKWMTTVAYSVVDRGGFDGGQLGYTSQVEQQRMLSADLFYDPFPRLSFGIGYVHVELDDNVDTNLSEGDRFHGMVKVHF
jgi:hypothetical protein